MAANEIKEIRDNLLSQDNRCTKNPIFVVQQKRRIYGLDLEYAERRVWIDTDGVETDERTEYGGTLTGYMDLWEYVTACFTEAACARFIEENRHNLNDPRIYVETGYRNHEWEAVRTFLLAQGTDAPTTEDRDRWKGIAEAKLPSTTPTHEDDR